MQQLATCPEAPPRCYFIMLSIFAFVLEGFEKNTLLCLSKQRSAMALPCLACSVCVHVCAPVDNLALFSFSLSDNVSHCKAPSYSPFDIFSDSLRKKKTMILADILLQLTMSY